MKPDTEMMLRLSLSKLGDGEPVWMAFGGNSMWPTLRATDNLLVAPLKAAPSRGDICLFECGGCLVVHRLVGRDGERLLFQGDHNWGRECVEAVAVKGRVESVRHAGGETVSTTSPRWQCITRWALLRSGLRAWTVRWLGKLGRKQLRPWYFAVLAILMWAPLNGLGVPLNNYLFGLRADHLLHASVYIPCSLFLIDLFPRRRGWAWLCAIGVGWLTESVQYLLPYRGFDINDMVANAIGATMGYGLIVLFKRLAGGSINPQL